MLLEFIDRLGSFIDTLINSPFRGILLSVVTIVSLLILKVSLGYFVKKYVYQRAQVETNAQNFMAVWGYIWTAQICVWIQVSRLMSGLSLSHPG